jgi:hypothetical protein
MGVLPKGWVAVALRYTGARAVVQMSRVAMVVDDPKGAVLVLDGCSDCGDIVTSTSVSAILDGIGMDSVP